MKKEENDTHTIKLTTQGMVMRFLKIFYITLLYQVPPPYIHSTHTYRDMLHLLK